MYEKLRRSAIPSKILIQFFPYRTISPKIFIRFSSIEAFRRGCYPPLPLTGQFRSAIFAWLEGSLQQYFHFRKGIVFWRHIVHCITERVSLEDSEIELLLSGTCATVVKGGHCLLSNRKVKLRVRRPAVNKNWLLFNYYFYHGYTTLHYRERRRSTYCRRLSVLQVNKSEKQWDRVTVQHDKEMHYKGIYIYEQDV